MSADPNLSNDLRSSDLLSTDAAWTEAKATDAQPTKTRSAMHPTDVVSLMFGALFVAAAAFWGLVDQDDLPGRGWYLPVLLIVVGLLGLVGSLGRRPQRSRRHDPA